MGLERIGGPKQERKSTRQEALSLLKQQGKQVSFGGMNQTSKLFVETVTRNKGGLSKSQIQRKLQKIKNKLSQAHRRGEGISAGACTGALPEGHCSGTRTRCL